MHAQAIHREPTSTFMAPTPASHGQKAAGVAVAIAAVAIAVSLVAAPRPVNPAGAPEAAPKPEAAGQVDKLLTLNSVQFRQGERSSSADSVSSIVSSSGDTLLTPEAIRFRSGERASARATDPLLTPNAIESRKDERSDSGSSGWSGGTGQWTIRRD